MIAKKVRVVRAGNAGERSSETGGRKYGEVR